MYIWKKHFCFNVTQWVKLGQSIVELYLSISGDLQAVCKCRVDTVQSWVFASKQLVELEKTYFWKKRNNYSWNVILKLEELKETYKIKLINKVSV